MLLTCQSTSAGVKKLLLATLLLVFSCDEVLDTLATDVISPIDVITFPANNSILDSTITVRANVTDVGEIREGDDVSFQVTVENTKKWESYPAFVELYVAGYLVNTVSTSTIQGFESQVLTIGPWTATPGDHIVTVKVDP